MINKWEMFYVVRRPHFGIDCLKVITFLTFTFSQNIYDRYSRNERPWAKLFSSRRKKLTVHSVTKSALLGQAANRSPLHPSVLPDITKVKLGDTCFPTPTTATPTPGETLYVRKWLPYLSTLLSIHPSNPCFSSFELAQVKSSRRT